VGPTHHGKDARRRHRRAARSCARRLHRARTISTRHNSTRHAASSHCPAQRNMASGAAVFKTARRRLCGLAPSSRRRSRLPKRTLHRLGKPHPLPWIASLPPLRSALRRTQTRRSSPERAKAGRSQ
jgi:hypothetical protein